MAFAAGPRQKRIAFDRFVLDVASHRLWRDGTPVPLRPKAWSVLRHLVERAGELVTRDDLHRDVWRGAAVSDDTLTQAIGELRRAFGDSARQPRFIETVHGLGFRFVAPPRRTDAPPPAATPEASRDPEPPAERDGFVAEAAGFVGRADELRRLRGLYAEASAGRRQLVLIGGETGIGKTSLIEQFVRGLATDAAAHCVLRGQCVQQYGQREPYLPVLDAIEGHARGPDGAEMLALLRRTAPRLADILMPLGDPTEARGGSAPPSHERVLRDLAALIEAAAARMPLILVLEDLHWSDASTMDLVSLLAQRPDPARLLVVGTFRPAEAALHAHPIRELRYWLRTSRRHTDLALGYLSLADVETYLRLRFGLEDARAAAALHERTDGNPLFVVMVVDEMVRAGALRRDGDHWIASAPALAGVPADLREVIAGQLRSVAAEALPVLEAASVAGVRFEPALVGTALERDPEDVEATCDRLARSHLFVQRPTDGAAYAFTHALQHQVIYEQVPELRRRRLHAAIATALEASPDGERAARAPELAMHFARAGLSTGAVEQLARCVGRAQERGAHREAASYAAQAFELLERLPAGVERDRRELALRLRLGISLNVTHGYVSPEVRQNYDRARALCEHAGDERQLFEVVSAIWYMQLGQRDVPDTRRNLDVLADIADRLRAPDLQRRVVLTRGRTAFWNGRFPDAVRILGAFLDDAGRMAADAETPLYGVAPIVAARFQRGLALWFVGCPEQAEAHVRAGLDALEPHSPPFDVASSYSQAALLGVLGRDDRTARAHAERCLAVCRDRDIAFFAPFAAFLLAASSEQPDERRLAAMREALTDHRARIGSFMSDLMLACVASACLRLGRWDEGLAVVEDGIETTRDSLERIYEAELWRLRGELSLGTAGRRTPRLVDEAHQSFARALEIATDQGARALALRARISQVRHAARPSQRADARAGLAALHASFTEGFDTPDLLEARALLEQPAG